MNTLSQPTRRMTDLIETLVAQTRSGAIRWSQKDAPGVFVYTSRSGSVLVSGPATGFTAIVSGHSIKALDGRGDVVESFSDGPALTNGSPYPPLRQLFELIVERYSEGNPLLESLRNEAQAARPGGSSAAG